MDFVEDYNGYKVYKDKSAASGKTMYIAQTSDGEDVGGSAFSISEAESQIDYDISLKNSAPGPGNK